MSDIRRISFLGVLFLVILRLAIGWQLLYEGLWKLNTQSTPTPWTSEPYLKNAQGPLRDHFRSLTGDPDDLNWMDYNKMSAKWDQWAESFIKFYYVDDTVKGWIYNELNGPENFTQPLDALPEGVVIPESYAAVMKFDPEKKQLVTSGKYHMTPDEKQFMLNLVADKNQDDEQVKKYTAAVNALFNQAKNLSFKEKLLVKIKGNPETAGDLYTGTSPDGKPEVKAKIVGEIEMYRESIPRYEHKLNNARIEYQYQHLDYDKGELMSRKNTIIAPIKKLEQDMQARFLSFLTTEQLTKGSVPPVMNMLRFVDLSTMWGLTILGALLIAGCCTRVAALGAAILVLQFYLAYPPIPGYPEVAGPEHSIIVNKNLIEVLVLLVFVFIPSGSWFGVDGIFRRIFYRNKSPKIS